MDVIIYLRKMYTGKIFLLYVINIFKVFNYFKLMNKTFSIEKTNSNVNLLRIFFTHGYHFYELY